MSTFAVTTSDGLIPSPRIIRIAAPPAVPFRLQIEYAGDEGRQAMTRSSPPIRTVDFQPVIPAAPGFEVVEITPAPETLLGYDLVRTPIIAWRLDGERAIPITAEPLEDHDGIGICTPEGSVFGPGPGDNVVTPEQWLPMMIARLQF